MDKEEPKVPTTVDEYVDALAPSGLLHWCRLLELEHDDYEDAALNRSAQKECVRDALRKAFAPETGRDFQALLQEGMKQQVTRRGVVQVFRSGDEEDAAKCE